MIAKAITVILIITFLQPASTVIDEEAYFGDVLFTDVTDTTYILVGHLFRHTYLEETQPS